MDTALFPFTCIAPDPFCLLEEIFGGITVYQPLSGTVPKVMRPLEQRGGLQIRFPVRGQESMILSHLEAYRRWAEDHTLSQKVFHKFRSETAPVQDESHTFKIREAILHRMKGNRAVPTPDELFEARLFLALAQDYDIRRIEIADDLARLSRQEDTLFQTLRGEPFPGDRSEETLRIDTDESEPPMIDERLRAWSRLLLEDDPLPAVYVTTSKEAFQLLTEATPGIDLLPGFDAISFPLRPAPTDSTPSESLMSYLSAVSKTPWSSQKVEKYRIVDNPGHPHVNMTIAVFPDTTPRDIFSRYLHRITLPGGQREYDRNTLMALVEL